MPLAGPGSSYRSRPIMPICGTVGLRGRYVGCAGAGASGATISSMRVRRSLIAASSASMSRVNHLCIWTRWSTLAFRLCWRIIRIASDYRGMGHQVAHRGGLHCARQLARALATARSIDEMRTLRAFGPTVCARPHARRTHTDHRPATPGGLIGPGIPPIGPRDAIIGSLGDE